MAVITDRLNARRAFHSEHAGATWISNCLHTHPLGDAKLDPVGVAWYLVNKAAYNHRTLFEGISVLPRASVHEFRGLGRRAAEYWTYRFQPPAKPVSEADLTGELSHLLVESVRRRLPKNSPPFLPLTGGYDSSAILGILRYHLGAPNVVCFTFIQDEYPSAGGDADIARRQAELAEYPHFVVRAYAGDIMKWLDDVGSVGNGIANLAGQFDGMESLSPKFTQCSESVIFSGEECTGILWSYSLKVPNDVLDAMQLFEIGTAPFVAALVDEATFCSMSAGIVADRYAILSRHSDVHDYQDLKDVLYVDQRLSNYRLAQGEYFQGDFSLVTSPFLDNTLLDFSMKMPGATRLRRRLYQTVVTRMLPQVFAIPRSRHGEWTTDWGKEFRKRSADIRRVLLETSSILDEMIPSERIIRLLEADDPPIRSSHARRTVNWLAALPRRVARKLTNESAPPPIITTGRVHTLRRLLAMRSFLNKTVDRQRNDRKAVLGN